MPTRRDSRAPASPLAFGIASMLSDIQRERRLTGQEIADLSGLHQSQVSRWLHAKVDISVVDMITLCDALGIDDREFLAAARRRAGEYRLRTSTPESTTPGE